MALPGLAACDATGGDDGLAILPTPAEVATCHTLALSTDPASDATTWSVSGGGSIDDAGVYSADKSVPAGDVVVTAEADGLTGTATVAVRTALFGKAAAAHDVPRQALSESTPEFPRAADAHGSRVYALVQSDSGVALTRSSDGGLTFGDPVTVGAGNQASVAIDAGNDDVVYVVRHTFIDDPQPGVLLSVSTDGGASFVEHRLLSAGTSDAALPAVASPAAGVVLVAATVDWQDATLGEQGNELLVWRDDAHGDGFGDLIALDNGYDATAVLSTVERQPSGLLFDTNSGRYGPSLSANRDGDVCLALARHHINLEVPGSITVRCSHDAGVSFSDDIVLATDDTVDNVRPRVALSADGLTMLVGYSHYNDVSLDSKGESRFRVSIDGGATFGAEGVLGDITDNDLPLYVADVEVFIDNAGVFWFARNVDFSGSVFLDKSCDLGATLSGGIAYPLDESHANPVFFESDVGVFAGVIRRGSGDAGVNVVDIDG